MVEIKEYRKRKNQTVTAVQLSLDTHGFTYNKWGSEQVCKPGDWLVNNNGDTYTVSNDSFLQTYNIVSPGVYRKHSTVKAEIMLHNGVVNTREGETHYASGDYLVHNTEDGTDDYAVKKKDFEEMYEPVDDQ